MREEACGIAENIAIGPTHFILKLESPYISERCQPGNFIMVAASDSHDPLLKRPFGILDAQPPHIWIYYEIVGRGTALISRLKSGDTTMVVGPLGNAFPPLSGHRILAIGGGRGIAPLFYALKQYRDDNRMFLAYGARTSTDLNLIDRIDGLSLDQTFLYTEDGSSGKQGQVTADIPGLIDDHQIQITLSCGPEAMFHSLHPLLKSKKTTDYVSMEALMGCGFGICHSCVVPAKDKSYKKVCSEGPVFRMEELAWPT